MCSIHLQCEQPGSDALSSIAHTNGVNKKHIWGCVGWYMIQSTNGFIFVTENQWKRKHLKRVIDILCDRVCAFEILWSNPCPRLRKQITVTSSPMFYKIKCYRSWERRGNSPGDVLAEFYYISGNVRTELNWVIKMSQTALASTCSNSFCCVPINVHIHFHNLLWSASWNPNTLPFP